MQISRLLIKTRELCRSGQTLAVSPDLVCDSCEGELWGGVTFG